MGRTSAILGPPVIPRWRRLAPVVLAAMLVASLPASAWAAAPIAGDDPAIGCGNLQQFGNSWPIPEDYGQVVFVPGMPCSIPANDSDPDGDPLTYSLVTPPAHGDLFMDASGFVAYTPDADFSTPPGSDPGGTWVSDSYVYQVSDGTATDTATHRFWVAPVNDPADVHARQRLPRDLGLGGQRPVQLALGARSLARSWSQRSWPDRRLRCQHQHRRGRTRSLQRTAVGLSRRHPHLHRGTK